MDLCDESHVCRAVYDVNWQLSIPGGRGMFENACLYAVAEPGSEIAVPSKTIRSMGGLLKSLTG